MKKLFIGVYVFCYSVLAWGMASEPLPVEPDLHPPVSISDASFAKHSLEPLRASSANTITVGDKVVGEFKDKAFYDGLGREVNFRGFNVSGSVKLVESGFKPFRNTQDAKQGFNLLKQKVGSNVVRFTIAWEGVHTAPDTIDKAYMTEIVAQMKQAIRHGMYVYIDYHSDLYSRHTFTQDSANTGNGAPKWIVEGGHHGKDNCGLPCLVVWSAHKLNDETVRSAMRAFWLNAPISTEKGVRYVQEEFLWQVGEMAKFVKAHLTPEEYVYVLGVEPLNEPFEAGLKELGLNTYREFDNLMLWPFYERMRAKLDQVGWGDKWVFAEPMVFWSSVTGVLAPATGGGYLDKKLGDGFVFSPHFYDQGRQGVNDFSVARNGAYFENFKWIRDEARFLNLPTMITEFGMWVGDRGKADNSRIINNAYQSIEITDVNRTNNSKKDRYVDLYTPLISATQWQWDIYYDNHKEYQNGNPNQLKTKFDAWNGEKYSVIKNYGADYNVRANLIERVYPRRVQGDLINFSYNAQVRDADDRLLNWTGLRFTGLHNGEQGIKNNTVYFKDKKFALAIWRDNASTAPTEIYIPRHFDLNQMLVITNHAIFNKSLKQQNEPSNTRNEVLITKDGSELANAGKRLFIWNDEAKSVSSSLHFALIAEGVNMSKQELISLQQAIKQHLERGENPIYLTGQMTHSGYVSE